MRQARVSLAICMVVGLLLPLTILGCDDNGAEDGNAPPVANAGPAQTVAVGATVHLEGSGSSDADGDTLSFQWAFVSRPEGSTTTLSDPLAVRPTFGVDRPGTYVVQLIVHDGTGASAPDTVTITTENSTPVANAGPDLEVCLGALVTLDGTGSRDPDGDTLTFRWSFMSRPPGSTATLSAATSATPTFTADVVGVYAISLIVNDGRVESAPDTVTVTSSTTAGALTVVLLAPPQLACASLTVTFQWRIEGQCAGVIYCADIITDKGVNPFDGFFEDIFHAGQETELEVTLGAFTYDPARFGWGVRVTACDDLEARCEARDPPCEGRSFASRVQDLTTSSRAPNCP